MIGNTMKEIIYAIFLSFFLCGLCGNAEAKKKKEVKKAIKREVQTPYDKLFKGKKAFTVNGLMKMHLMAGKVYAEFPIELLNRDLALTSSIEDISDNGEGVVGQFAGRVNQFRFTLQDSMLQARLVRRYGVKNTGMGKNADQIIERSNTPGIFQSYKILAYTPDKKAVVVDMTELFLESSRLTNPFPSYAGNSLYGFVQRIHKFQSQRSELLGICGNDNSMSVRCNLGFNVDRLVLGSFMQAKDVPVSVTVNKILMLLPEDPMRPRLADSRIGVNAIIQTELPDVCQGIKTYYITKRWRIEPVDEIRYKQGEMVDVKKPIVFYIDTLMPDSWIKYVKAGAEAWNAAFEKIGLRNVVRTELFPKDSSFDAGDIHNSVIRYAPSWMYYPQYSMHTDPRTGEILNAFVYLPANVASYFYTSRTEETMAVDPSVRKARLSEEQFGEMFKAKMMQAIGRCLGLTDNYAASSVYPVDSLRSASFTRKYGVVASVMDDFTCNKIAQPEDVKKGVVLVQQNLGPYDYEVIKYLYKPIMEVKHFREEKAVLGQWIKEMQDKPYCLYMQTPDNWAKFDPRVSRKDLGDDPVKAREYIIRNLKIAINNFFEWYKEDDMDLSARRLCYMELTEGFKGEFAPIVAYLGGIELYDEQMPSYKVVPKETQRRMLIYLLNSCKDLDWLDNKDVLRQLQIMDLPSTKIRESLFGEIMSRLHYVSIAAQKSGGEYTPEEFVLDIYNHIWKNTMQNKPLTKHDMDMEQIFLASIIATSCVDAPVTVFSPNMENGFRSLNPEELKLVNRIQQGIRQSMNYELRDEVAGYNSIPYFEASNGPIAHVYLDLLLKTRDMIQRAVISSTGETKLHYEFMLYRIKKALEKK